MAPISLWRRHKLSNLVISLHSMHLHNIYSSHYYEKYFQGQVKAYFRVRAGAIPALVLRAIPILVPQLVVVVAVGTVLAVDFGDFYRLHSFGFHTFRTVILQILLTLTNSTSFGEYLNAGMTYPKLKKMREIPGRPAQARPASLSPVDNCHEALLTWS